MATRSLEQRVTALEETVAGLQNLPNELAEFRRETNARFDRLEQRMITDKEELYAHARVLKEELYAHMRMLKEELSAHMRMLHEELIDRIKIGREAPDGVGLGAPRQSRRRKKQ